MPDSTRLSARIWLPEGAGPVPAILEYIPYRKRDMVRARDERNHPWLAARGYACLRVDMRGSGDSEGTMPDMYAPDELGDARHVIAWIANQPWCSGRVGMFGTSWGGTASLQAAADAPGPLKAVLANCATIDRFEDDIHWMGGCLLTDTLEWAVTLPAILAAPPDSGTAGPDWQQIWHSRLSALTFPHENWVAHKTRGAYWRRGSIRFQADRLTCPVLTIGGWADRYANSVMPLVAARPDLCWGIVGPWGHHYPDHGAPGPALGFQQIALDWWDHWLTSDAPAPLDWPRLRLWQRRFDPPQDRLTHRNGHWVATLPGQTAAGITLHPGPGGLGFEPAARAIACPVPFDLDHGQCAGDTGYFGRVGGLPLDQAPDDARALSFDTAPLRTPAQLMGAATLTLMATADHMPAQLACRICDVAPDGRSNLVTRTVLNLALDDMLDAQRPVTPGTPFPVTLTLPTTAYRFSPGHRVRLSLAACYWPLIWPTSQDPNLRVDTAQAVLTFPQCTRGTVPLDAPLPAPEDLPADKPWTVSAAPLIRDACGWRQPCVTLDFPGIGVSLAYETSARFRITPPDPRSATATLKHRMTITRADGTAQIDSHLTAGPGITGPEIASHLRVAWNGTEVLNRQSTTLFQSGSGLVQCVGLAAASGQRLRKL